MIRDFLLPAKSSLLGSNWHGVDAKGFLPIVTSRGRHHTAFDSSDWDATQPNHLPNPFTNNCNSDPLHCIKLMSLPPDFCRDTRQTDDLCREHVGEPWFDFLLIFSSASNSIVKKQINISVSGGIKRPQGM